MADDLLVAALEVASFIDIFSFITLSIISASLEICSSCFLVLCVISIIRVYSEDSAVAILAVVVPEVHGKR